MGGTKNITKLKAAGYEVSRSDQLAIDPAAISLPPPGHPLFDETSVDAALVQSLLREGQRTPIQVCQDGELENGAPRLIVVNGRHRWAAINFINTGYVPGPGDEPKPEGLFKIQYRVVEGTTLDLVRLSIVANEDRVNNSFRSAALKYASYVRQAQREGMTEAAARQALMRAANVAWATCEKWWLFSSLDKSVQDAIEAGTIPSGSIPELAKLSREQQAATLTDIAAVVAVREPTKGRSPDKATTAEVEAVVRAARSGAKLDEVEISVKRPGRRRLEEVQALLQAALREHTGEEQFVLRGMNEALRFALGHEIKNPTAKRLWREIVDGADNE